MPTTPDFNPTTSNYKFRLKTTSQLQTTFCSFVTY